MRYRFVILASLLIFWTESARSAERLRVATEGAYPPFNYLENGELKGFDVDIAKAICARMQYECTLEAVPWSRIIEGLERKDYDLVIASMAFTEERARRVEFSKPYYRSHSVLVGDPERYSDSSAEALRGVRIAAARGTIQADYLVRAYHDSTAVLADNQPQAQELLKAGKADLLIGDAIELLTFMQTPEGSEYGYVGDPISSEFLQSSAHIAARKGNTELISQVNDALSAIKGNGTYDRINDRYFPFSIY